MQNTKWFHMHNPQLKYARLHIQRDIILCLQAGSANVSEITENIFKAFGWLSWRRLSVVCCGCHHRKIIATLYCGPT